MARVVESAIQSLEQQQRAESKAAESTAVRSATSYPLSESALHDALGIPPPCELQPHAHQPHQRGKADPVHLQVSQHNRVTSIDARLCKRTQALCRLGVRLGFG